MRGNILTIALVLFLISIPVMRVDAAASGDATVTSIPGLGEMTEEDIAELGEFTQELISEYPTADGNRLVSVIREPATSMSYDPATNRYRYTLPDGEWVECNIPQGAYYRGGVEFTTSENISSLSVLRDGVTSIADAPYRASGNYVVTFWDINVEGDAYKAYRFDFVFTIYSDYRINISLINAPLGMEIEELIFNGQSRTLNDNKNALLIHDGDFRVVFTGDGAVFEMVFTRDTTPPVIEISPEYIYRSTVDEYPHYEVPDKDTIVTVRRNYVEENMPYGELLLNGYYELKATDPVGNERIYAFTVKAPLPVFSARMLVFPLIFIAAAIGVAIYTRRNMQVR